MKKAILGILLLLVALPALVGLLVERRYDDLVARLAAVGLEVVATDYRRGWFRSTATTEMRIELPAAQRQTADSAEFTLRSAVVHGPLPFDGFALAEITTELPELSRALGDDNARTLKTLIFMDGSGHGEIDWPAVERPLADGGGKIAFGAVRGEIDFTARAERVDLRLETSGGRVVEQGRELLDMEALRFVSQTHRSASGLSLGRGALQIERLELQDREGPASVALHGIEISGESRELETLVEAEVSYRLASVDVEDRRYGPGLLRFKVGRLAAPALVGLQQALESLSRQPGTEAEMNMAAFALLGQAAAELLQNDPTIAISPLRIDTPDGQVYVEFSLQSQGLRMSDLNKMPALLDKLSGDLEIRMPERVLRTMLMAQTRRQIELQLAEQAQHGGEPAQIDVERRVEAEVIQQIALWERQGFVTREGDALTAVASLSSGLLSLNGKTIPLPSGRQ